MNPLLTFTNVTYSYPSGNEALKDITFMVNKGEKVALLGENGAGKSTLMLHTNGLLVPVSGSVEVEGLSTSSKKNIMKVRQIVGLVFQNPDDQLFMPTVREDIAFGPSNMRLPEDEINERVNRAMEMTGTFSLANKSPFSLSGGQKKSVSIATVLSMSPEILVMDEPTAGLDYKGILNFKEIVRNLSQTILLSTHDLELAKELCERAIVLKNGQKVYDGPICSFSFEYLEELS